MNSIWTKIGQILPYNYYKVYDISGRFNPDYKNLIRRDGSLELFSIQSHFYLYTSVKKKVFQLFHLPSDREDEAVQNYMLYKEKLILFHECLPDADINVLKDICDAIRKNVSWTACHIAVEAGLTGIYSSQQLKPMINSTQDDFIITPLHLAIELDKEIICKELIEAGASVTFTNNNSENAIHLAVQNGSNNVLEILCKYCSSTKRIESFKALNKDGETPLHVISKLNNAKKCSILLNYGASPSVKGTIGSAVHYACKYKATSVLKLMLEEEPDAVNTVCSRYNSLPIHWCKTSKEAKLLVEAKSPLNPLSRHKYCPIHVMAQKGRIEMILFLILRNADINARDVKGNTALHIAAKEGEMLIVKALILFEADVNIKNVKDQTAYTYAKDNGTRNVTMILNILSDQNQASSHNLGYENSPINSQTISSSISYRPKLLSLDGGGIRGVILCQILVLLEKRTGKKATQLFDWIAGTSTGAMVAIALAQGKTAIECQKFYFEMKNTVFEGARPYATEPLENFLKSFYDETKTMKSIKEPLKVIITATLADRTPARLHIFRNYSVDLKDEPLKLSKHLSQIEVNKLKSVPESDQLIWKVARYSAAAPTYFNSSDGFIDGAVFANNPTVDALTEINKYYSDENSSSNQDNRIGVVLSLGTGERTTSIMGNLDIKVPTKLTEMLECTIAGLELQKLVIDGACESNAHIVNRAKAWCDSLGAYYFRLNPYMSTNVAIDETDDLILLELLWDTRQYVLNNMDTIEDILKLIE